MPKPIRFQLSYRVAAERESHQRRIVLKSLRRNGGQHVLGQVQLDQIRQAFEGFVVNSYQLIATQIDLLQVNQIHFEEALTLEHLQTVASKVEHLRAGIHSFGQRRQVAATTFNGLLAALPFARANLGRACQRNTSCHRSGDRDPDPGQHIVWSFSSDWCVNKSVFAS